MSYGKRIVISSAMSRHLGTSSLAVGVRIMVIWAINWVGSLQQQNCCCKVCGVLSLLFKFFIGRAIEKKDYTNFRPNSKQPEKLTGTWKLAYFTKFLPKMSLKRGEGYYQECPWLFFRFLQFYFLLCFKQIFKIRIFVNVVSCLYLMLFDTILDSFFGGPKGILSWRSLCCDQNASVGVDDLVFLQC